jgi:hypothetical protein
MIETESYFIVDQYPSSSSPGKIHEVRTSKRDGKTYCSCRGWIVKLNQQKAGGGPAICTHIAQYMSKQKTTAKPVEVIVMDFESFASVKRGIAITSDAKVASNVKVRR